MATKHTRGIWFTSFQMSDICEKCIEKCTQKKKEDDEEEEVEEEEVGGE